MKEKFNQVYQFKITLKGIRPPIWRRIQVPGDYNFWDLHVAIQDVFGWVDYHLHEFAMVNPYTGIGTEIGFPDEEFSWGREVLPEGEQKIADWFNMENKVANYTYDFGDNWQHKIELEKILPRKKGVKYPVCIKGRRACPPEDVGGIWGYEDFLEIIDDPNNEEYEETIEWVGGEFDPEHFDPKEVHFDDPDERRKIAFG